MDRIVVAALIMARTQVGVKESGGNNCGPRVRKYLAAVGLGEGPPWCAAFVAWLLREAGVKDWPSGVEAGDTWHLEDWARSRSILFEQPKPGDVFLLIGANGRPTHTGIITTVDAGNGRVGTIEGNTGGDSDTDGEGVYAKSRPIASCRFVRWASLPKNRTAIGPTVRYADKTVLCNPRNEGGTTRCDLRKVVEALGLALVVQGEAIHITGKPKA